eukprot:1182301-Prorocentrum_minimum.AAC.4
MSNLYKPDERHDHIHGRCRHRPRHCRARCRTAARAARKHLCVGPNCRRWSRSAAPALRRKARRIDETYARLRHRGAKLRT